MVVLECFFQHRDERFTQFEEFADFVFTAVADPRNTVIVPRIDEALDGEDDRLYTADADVAVRGVAEFGRPEDAGEAGIGYAAQEVLVVVQVTVEDERIRCGECAHLTDFREGRSVAECVEDGFCIEGAEKGVILFSVETGREFGVQGEAPASGVVARVAFVELEAVYAEVNEGLALVVGENSACFGRCKVRDNAAPDEVIPGIRRDVVVNRAVRMGEGVFPEIDVESAFLEVINEFLRVRITVAPLVGAGIGVGLPAGFETDDGAGNVVVAEIIGGFLDLFGIPAGIAAVEGAEPPFGNVASAAGEHIVLLYDVGDGIAFDDVHVHTFGGGNQHAHDRTGFLADGVEIVRVVRRTACRDVLCRGILRLAAGEFGVAGGIEVHTVPFVGDEEGNGRVGFAVVGDGVGVHVEAELASAVVELLELKTEAEDMAVVLNGKLHKEAAGSLAAGEVRRGIGHVGFDVVEVVAEHRGDELFGGTESEFLHVGNLQYITDI